MSTIIQFSWSLRASPTNFGIEQFLNYELSQGTPLAF